MATQPARERGLRVADLCAKLGIKESTVYKLMRLGKLPRPRMLNGTVIWIESDIDKFMRSLPRAAPLSPPPAPTRRATRRAAA